MLKIIFSISWMEYWSFSFHKIPHRTLYRSLIWQCFQKLWSSHTSWDRNNSKTFIFETWHLFNKLLSFYPDQPICFIILYSLRLFSIDIRLFSILHEIRDKLATWSNERNKLADAEIISPFQYNVTQSYN